MSGTNQTVTPMSTEGFLNTLGTDTHMAYTDGKYANVTQVISDLKYLGIDQVRDGITNGLDANGNYNGSAPLSTYISMAQAGIKFTFIIEATSSAVIATQLALINQVETAVPGSVLAIEGPNEVNNQPITFNGLTGQQGAVAAQQALYAAVKADATLTGVPVDYFTGYTAGSTDPTTTAGLANFDNQHPYPNYGEAPAFWVSRAQALTNLSAADVATAKAVYTETGYTTNQVNTDVQEQYTLDLLMDTAQEGISQTYLYDLLDAYAPGSPQGDDGFGLFDYTGAQKPVATAIHNLTALLQDTGATAATFTPAKLTYAISGLPASGNSMVLEKSNGTYVLVVWAEPQIYNTTTNVETAAPSENVTVTLSQSFGSIQVYDPTSGTSAIASYSNSKSVTVAVTDHPILIELAAAAAVAGPVLTIAAPVQVANTTEVTVSGTVTDSLQTTIQVRDYGTILGYATVSNGSWSYTSANLAAGSHVFNVFASDTGGNTSTASDSAFTVITPALTITYNGGVDTSTTTRTVSVTTPVTIGGTGNDTIVLAMAEDAYLGDAQFTVSVDGTQIGGVQTATALHSAGLSQSFTLQGNFGAGAHTVSINFLNDALAIYSNGTVAGDRNLYVDAITGDGVTTVENVEQNLAGTNSYKITLPATTTKPTPVAPIVALGAPTAVAGGTATLGTAVAGNTGDTLTVKLGSDADFATGSLVALSNGSLIYTPGVITAANVGTDTISYIVTDSTNGLITAETQKVTLAAPAKPAIAITSQVLTQNTGASTTDTVTSNGAVMLTGTVTGETGTVVSIVDGATVLGNASISNGTWSYATTLSAGAHSLHAVATDPFGDIVTTAAEPTITVDTTAPVLTIAVPVQVANTSEVTLSGTVSDSTQTTVQVRDYSTVLGYATVSNGSWSYTSANLTVGSHVFNILATDLAGNTSTASDAAFTVSTPALYITYSTGVDTSTTTRTVSVTTPVTIGGTGSDTIVLSMAEDAYLGDAQFTVGVDYKQVGGVQTITALQSAGQTQNFTLQGNFGAGPHTITIDFLNDAYAFYNNGTVAGDRNLYVDAITGDGVTTVENAAQNYAGGASYSITLPGTVTKPTPVAPIVALGAPTAVAGGTATLGTAVAGNTGDTLTVKLGSDADFATGSSVALSNGSLIYTPGVITAANVGTDTISYIVTDSTNGLTTAETQKVTLAAPAKPAIAITSQVLTQNTGASTTDTVTSNGAVTLTGTVTGETGTVVSIVDGATVLGNASISNGTWSYSTTLGAGTHSLHAVATDPFGDMVTTAAEPTITVDTTAPVLTIAVPVQVANTSEVTLSGTVSDSTQTTVQVRDYSTVLGYATVSNGSWSYTSANLTVGSHVFNVMATDLAGNTSTASDPAFTVSTPTLYITYNVGVDTSTTTRTVSVTAPVTIGGTGSDTIVLAMAEDAFLGDAQFTVSVDGKQIGGVQTVTALHSAALSQSFTLQGNFGAGAHKVSVDFLNDAYAFYNNGALAGDRNLYVDAITGDGVATVENAAQNLAGTVAYSITLPATGTTPTQLAPVVTLAAAPTAAPGGTAALGTAAAGNSGDTLSVKLVSDADFTTGSSVALSNSSLIYTPGIITATNSGSDTISYTVTDSTNGLTTTETQKIVLTAPVVTATQDEVLATVSTGTGTAQQEVALSAATPIIGTFVPTSTSGIGTNALVLYNWNPATQLQGFLSDQSAGDASIIGIGDSTTSGFGSAASGWTRLSYLNEMTQVLNQDGIAAQSDNFLGSQFNISNGEDQDNRLTPIGYPTTSTDYDGGFTIVSGGNAIYLDGTGKGVNFQLDTPGNYNRVTVSYIDVGSGSINLTVDGVTVGSMNFGNTGETLTQTVNIPAGLHSDLAVVSAGANPVYIQGASFSSTTSPAIQVYNAGIGGWDSNAADSSVYQGQTLKGSSNGFGQTAGAVALSPSLAIVDLGINDIASAEDTTAQSLANIEQIVATLQAAGTDVIIMIPQPFGSSDYATELPALRAGLEAYSTANNVPIIDLSATYGNSESALEAAGLKADLLHPDATLYADIGSQIAALLTAAINNSSTGVQSNTVTLSAQSQSTGQSYTLVPGPMTITGTDGNDMITATDATLNPADNIDGGIGTNTLVLSGGGSFDLGAPGNLNNIQVVSAAEGQAAGDVQTVRLRNGLDVTLNVASGTAEAGNANPETITIYGGADASTINLGTGTDNVTLGSASETVNAAATGLAVIRGTAAQAGALIVGNGLSSTSLEITDGGTAVLNAADSDLTVKLDFATNLTLSNMQFITADGSAGDSVITALSSDQTLIGGAGDTLVGATAFGDLFQGSAALLNHNIIQNFGGSDKIDVTDILASHVTQLNWTANGRGGVLTISDGSHSAALNLAGSFTSANFTTNSDGAGGTIIGYV